MLTPPKNRREATLLLSLACCEVVIALMTLSVAKIGDATGNTLLWAYGLACAWGIVAGFHVSAWWEGRAAMLKATEDEED